MKGPAVIIHNLDHARAALAAAAALGQPVILLSAPGAAAYLGASVFRDMVDQAAAEYPEVPVSAVLDCGGDAGLALGAFRHGLKAVRLAASEEVLAKVRDIARQQGAAVDESNAPALDLLDEPDPAAACRAWLAGS